MDRVTDLRITANSFDLFDTLLTRRALRPRRIFEDVERALGVQGFSDARVAAEHYVGTQPTQVEQLLERNQLIEPGKAFV